MSQILLKQGMRCQEHPHRPADQKCDRCGQPFCSRCLLPSARLADGTRNWYCARCTALIAEERAREALEGSIEFKIERAANRGRIALLSGLAALLVIGAGTAVFALGARRFGQAAGEQTIGERGAVCGELSRIRAIGSIGTQSAEDAVNVLTYPQRAQALVSGGALPQATDASSLVDECNTGWKPALGAEGVQLPVNVTFDTKRDGSFVQRFALWQDPSAAREAWVRDFELLASTTESGDDFQPLPLDREGQLRQSTEAQWFEIQRPGPGSAGQKFPEAVPIRRLQVRILSTWGVPRLRAKVDALALGEVAAYGPDLEVAIGDTDTGGYALSPRDVRALAGQPKFVMFMNMSRTATHRLVSAGQEKNFDVTIEPGQVKSVQFTAGRAGVYEFVCKVPGHEQLGLRGTIRVR
jgi:plastocyanin